MVTGTYGRSSIGVVLGLGLAAIVTAGFLAVISIAISPSSSVSKRKTCLDCHKDFKERLKKKHVHEPAKECETCHKRHGFAQKLVLLKNPPGLCTDCHENVAEEVAGEGVHEALTEGGCTVCHEPHAADRDGLLRTVETGASVCVVCHEDLTDAMAEENAHKPFKEGDCASCHQPHASTNPNLLVGSEEETCATCHKDVANEHGFPSFGDFACTDCHDPHGSSKKEPFAAYAHEPFASGECDACHSIEEGEVAFGDDFPRQDLCADCHDDKAALVGGGESHFGAEALKDGGASTCLECHDPHKSQNEPLLARSEEALCRQCHETLPNVSGFKGSVHQPFGKGECSSCHEPHGGGGAHHLARQSTELCADCHGEKTEPAREGQFRHEALDVAECTDCHSPHVSENATLLTETPQETCGSCHDKVEHAAPHPPYATSTCGACHQNHSTEQALLLAPLQNLCLRCHSEQVTRLRAVVGHPPAREESCDFCHAPHGGEHDGLLTEAQGDLCASCHDLDELIVKEEIAGEPAERASISLHAPMSQGECSSCHDAHGSDADAILVRERENLCYGCHADEKVSFAEGKVHDPVDKGDCAACHTPHGSTAGNLKKSSEPGLCIECHDISDAIVEASHDGFDVGGTKCTACHTPHSSPREKLLNPFVHEPFADGSCDACHEDVGESATEGTQAIASVSATVCLDCHDEKNEQQGHHKQEGLLCVTCHSPHASKFESLLSNPARLCRSCHEDVFLAGANGEPAHYLHQPIVDGTCLDCHKMHEPSDESYLARAQKELCSECHTSMSARQADLTQHDPYRKGKCTSCHATHASNEAHMLKKEERRLCKSCHGLTTEKIEKAHKGIPLTGEGCVSCHDPHSTEKAASVLVRPYLHAPYEEGECSSCHDDKGVPARTQAVCMDCHEEGDNFAAVHTGGRSDKGGEALCLDCHSPHAGFEHLFRRPSQAETCLQCHDRKEFTRTTVHGALEEGCTTCHDVHKSNFAELTSVEVSTLCIDCHEESDQHNHPIGAEYSDPRTGDPMNCLSCHEPHSSDHEFMMSFDHKRDLCVQCHSRGTMKVPGRRR